MKEQRELRYSQVRASQSATGRMLLRGTAIQYNALSSDLGGFRETILPGAARATLVNSDLRFLRDHQPHMLLGRESAGTLQVEENSRGVHFAVSLPNSPDGKSVYESVSRGDLDQMSFAMRVEESSWDEILDPDDEDEDDKDRSRRSKRMIPRRCCSRIALIELSAVSWAAYPQGVVSLDEDLSARCFPDGMPDTLQAELRSRTSLITRSAPAIPPAADINQRIAAMDLRSEEEIHADIVKRANLTVELIKSEEAQRKFQSEVDYNSRVARRGYMSRR
jgi:HK97 family phage prohead protease